MSSRPPRSRWAIVLGALVVALPIVRAQSADLDLLHRSDVGAFVPTAFRARLSLDQPGQARPTQIELWRSGSARTLLRMLDPAERGKYLLRLGDDLWLLAPGTKKPVKISPTQRIYGAATIDVLLGMRLAETYRIAGVRTEPSAGGPIAVFDLRALADAQTFTSVEYRVQTASSHPLSALYRLHSGREALRVEFVDWAASGRYARRVDIRDLLRKGALTRVAVDTFEERAVPDGLFDLTDPTARRALDKSGAPASPRVF